MINKGLFQEEKPASTQPPTPTAPSKQTAIDVQPLRDEVAKRAYSLYLAQGCPQGHDVQHWLEAEDQVTKARQDARRSVLM
jgi:hypothetical protein